MRKLELAVLAIMVGAAGCGSEDDGAVTPTMPVSTSDAGSTETTNTAPAAGEMIPATGDETEAPGDEVISGDFPPTGDPAPGYKRFFATPIEGIEPGDDTTWCMYVLAPVEEDMNVLKVSGGQGVGGHHLTVFGVDAEKMDKPLMEPFGCDPKDGHSDLGTWLGSALVSTPDGAAFRVKKGQGLLLNLHYINTEEAPIDGEAYFDILMEPAADNPTQPMASVMVTNNVAFSIPPGESASSSIDCVIPEDIDVVMAANHMHEWGSAAKLSIIRGDTQEEIVLKEDVSWSPEGQLNPVFTTWPVEEPFQIHAGDTMRISCSWQNTTAEPLTFPKEMCIGTAFSLAKPDATEPIGNCQAGMWTPPGADGQAH